MIFSRLSFDEISIFYRQVAAMLRSGVPLSDAITVLHAEQDLPGIRKKLARIKKDMTAGIAFEDSLAAHPDIFSPVLIRILTSDISNEQVADVLLKFAETTERSGEARKKTTSILYYPMIVLTHLFEKRETNFKFELKFMAL